MKTQIHKMFLTFSSQSKALIIAIYCLFNVANAWAQVNIAPLAVAGASTCNTGPCSALNDLNFGVCGTQQMWITTAAPPSGAEWLEFVWPSTQSMNKITIHHAHGILRVKGCNQSVTGVTNGFHMSWRYIACCADECKIGHVGPLIFLADSGCFKCKR